MYLLPLSSSVRSTLPSSPGVYFFKNAAGLPIYIGKAKHLHHRLTSYFRSPTQLGSKTAQMISQAHSLNFIEVGSDLEAILLEAKLIKKYQPFYNLISKDDKSPYYIHLSTDKFPRPIINHYQDHSLAGPFLNSLVPKRILKLFRQITPYCTAPKSQKKPCFYSYLNLCSPCPKSLDFSPRKYQQNIRRLKLLLSGNFSYVIKDLTSAMQTCSKLQHYEQAVQFRNQIQTLNQLLLRPILPEDYLLDPNLEIDKRQRAITAVQLFLEPYFPHLNPNRIETYDVAHLSGQSATAAMTVALNGTLSPSNYRHFKIKTLNSSNDPVMLAEVISRRFARTGWSKPDLIVLDGGVPQLSYFQISNFKFQIPMISLAKKQEIILLYFNNEYIEINLPKDNPGLQLLQHLRDEAHRFSRRLHFKYRNALLLNHA